MTRLSTLLACATLLAGGCSTAPCKDGTLYLSVTLSGTAVDADSLGFAIALDSGQTLNASVAHTPGQGMGTVQISFAAGYPSGKKAIVTATAQKGSTQVGTGTTNVDFSAGGCRTASISVTGGGDTGDMSMSTGDGGLLANGQACGGDGQCGSNHCVDGVCCDTACTGQCEACDIANNPGTCSPVTGAPHGTRPVCNGSGPCGGTCDGTHVAACSFPGNTTQCRMQSCTSGMVTAAANCDGNGACPAPNAVNCNPLACNAAGTACSNACTNDNQCTGSTPYCDTLSGACTPKKPNGRTCTAATECTSTYCVDGYCCDQGCGGSCQQCNASGKQGTCTQVTSGSPLSTHPACQSDGTAVCQGSCAAGNINCTYPTVQCKTGSCNNGTITSNSTCSNGSCPNQTSMTCTMGYNCDATSLMCKTTCTVSTDCQQGLTCTGNGRCCPPPTNNVRYVDATLGVDDPKAGGGQGPCAFKSLTYALGKSPNNVIIQTAGNNDVYSVATTNEVFPITLFGSQQVQCKAGSVIKGNGPDPNSGASAVVLQGLSNTITGCTIDAMGGINSILVNSAASSSAQHLVQGNKVTGGKNGVTVGGNSGFVTVDSNTFLGGGTGIGFNWTVTNQNPGHLTNNTFQGWAPDIQCPGPSPSLDGSGDSDGGSLCSCNGCAYCPFP